MDAIPFNFLPFEASFLEQIASKDEFQVKLWIFCYSLRVGTHTIYLTKHKLYLYTIMFIYIAFCFSVC